MPKRIEIKFGHTIEVCGPVSLVVSYEDFAVLSVGMDDADSEADVKTAARRWRKQLDRARNSVNDSGNSHPAS